MIIQPGSAGCISGNRCVKKSGTEGQFKLGLFVFGEFGGEAVGKLDGKFGAGVIAEIIAVDNPRFMYAEKTRKRGEDVFEMLQVFTRNVFFLRGVNNAVRFHGLNGNDAVNRDDVLLAFITYHDVFQVFVFER